MCVCVCVGGGGGGGGRGGKKRFRIYHIKEFVIRLRLSALAMTAKYTTDLASF